MLQSDLLIIIYLYLSICILAVISQVFVLTFYYLYIGLKSNFAARLIFLIGIFDILVWLPQIIICIFRIITNETVFQYSNELCTFSGVFFNFGLLMNMLFSLLICLSTFMEVVVNHNPLSYERYFYLGITTYSIFCSLIPFISGIKNIYGDSDEIKCWITEQLYQILGFYLHLWIIFACNIFLIVKIINKLKRNKIYVEKIQITFITRIMWVPIIIMFFWIEASIRRVFYEMEGNYTLKMIHYILMPLQGIVNAFAYANVNEDVKNKIKSFFKCNYNDLKIINEEKTNNFISDNIIDQISNNNTSLSQTNKEENYSNEKNAEQELAETQPSWRNKNIFIKE